jgi:GTP pyrophosphokinase
VRPFETGIVVTVNNGKGVLARVAGALASAEADINQVDMGDDSGEGAMDIRFVIAVHDIQQLEVALRNLRRTPSVLRAERIGPSSVN